jgi:hypothetical protein
MIPRRVLSETEWKGIQIKLSQHTHATLRHGHRGQKAAKKDRNSRNEICEECGGIQIEE